MLRERLEAISNGEASVYRDTYYDWPGGDLTTADRELRVQTIEAAESRRSLLTWKEPAVDAASGSKPEHETAVADPTVIDVVLTGLGLGHLIAFEKHCRNYKFSAYGRELQATLVTVPEIDGMFIELETLDVAAALDDVRTVLRDLGIDDDLTTELYTDAVLRARDRTRVR